jgi:hypothetical protein
MMKKKKILSIMIIVRKMNFIKIKSSISACVIDVSIFKQIFINEYVTMCNRNMYKKEREEIRLNNRCAYITLL